MHTLFEDIFGAGLRHYILELCVLLLLTGLINTSGASCNLQFRAYRLATSWRNILVNLFYFMRLLVVNLED
ncbi:hypothetical protein V1511DRAFT_497684 [Dipodascopsis uninucleata]